MKRISIAIVVSLLTVISSYAQINPQPGYIITNLNDTIYGNIDYRSASQNARFCVFKGNGETEYKHYTTSDIHAYRFVDNGKYYVSRRVKVKGQENKYFLEYLIKGIVSLYYLPGDRKEHYFFENELGEMTPIQVFNNESENLEVLQEQKKQTVLTMYKVFDKSVNIRTKLASSTLSKTVLSEFVKEYHGEICTSGEECIQFEYDKEEHTVSVEIFAGLGAAYHSISIEEWKKYGNMTSIYPVLNVGADFHLPRLSNHLFVQSMFSLTYMKDEEPSRKGVSLESFIADFQVGAAYSFNTKKLNPVLQAGFLATSFFNSKSGETIGLFQSLSGNFKLNCGFYAGIRLEYPLSKGALLLNSQYKFRPSSDYSTVELGIGYKF